MSGVDLEPEEVVVLDDLRERSDGTYEKEAGKGPSHVNPHES